MINLCELAKKQLIPSHFLTTFETERYYRNKNRIVRVYSRNNLPTNGTLNVPNYWAYVIISINMVPVEHIVLVSILKMMK